jgi:hypothetical protein
MNCLEFRRHVGAEPSATLPAVLAHCEECAACARYRDEMRSLDRLLGRAMRIDMAPGSRREEVSGTRPTLTAGGEVVSRAPGTSRAMRGTRSPRRWLAMAASLVAGLLVAATLWLSYPETTLAAEVIGHVVSEPEAMKSSRPLAAQAITEVLQPSGVRLRPGIGAVTFAMRCVFEGRVVPHLVVQTEAGPVTVLLLAHRQVGHATRVEADGYSALVLPAPRGSIAIVGRDASQIDSIARRVFEDVDWET